MATVAKASPMGTEASGHALRQRHRVCFKTGTCGGKAAVPQREGSGGKKKKKESCAAIAHAESVLWKEGVHLLTC